MDNPVNPSLTRILIADDHPVVREGFTHILSGEPDFEVVGKAANGAEAVQMAARLQPDVILMDLQMPLLDGVAAIRQLKQTLPQIKVIILTTFDSDDYIFEGIRAGAQGYLLKDVPPAELIQAVRQVRQGWSPSHPAITNRLFEMLAAPSISRPPASPTPSRDAANLSERELDVLRLMAQGDRNKEIAHKLNLSENTVKGYVATIFQKLNVSDRTEATLYALRQGIIKLGL